MYKTIVPELVTFDTNLSELPSFILCENFNFYKPSVLKGELHYKVYVDNSLQTPKEWSFRSEYTLVVGKKYYYYRRIAFWNPVFCYDSVTKEITFNTDYLRLPFHIGGIPSVGELISGLIESELFFKGVIILRGIAYVRNKQVIALSSPGFNGKTTFLKRQIIAGCSYIAEDYLIIKGKDHIVYPTCPLTRESIWRRRGIDKNMKNLFKSNNVIATPLKISKLIFSQNIAVHGDFNQSKKLVDYLILNSMYFMGNIFIKSYIFYENLGDNIPININNFMNYFENALLDETVDFKYEEMNELSR